MNSCLALNTGEYIHELDDKHGKFDSISRCVLEMFLRTHSIKQVRFLGFNNLTEIKISEFNSIYPRLYKEIGSEKSTTQDAGASIFFWKNTNFLKPSHFSVTKIWFKATVLSDFKHC